MRIIETKAIQSFRQDTDKQKALISALDNAAIKEAFSLIRDGCEMQDSEGIPCVPGLHHDSVVAREYHRLFGINQVFKTLQAMATPPPKRPDAPEPLEEFVLPEEHELHSGR